MCARYLVDDEAFDINEIINAAERNIRETGAVVHEGLHGDGSIVTSEHRAAGSYVAGSFRYGEIFPGTYAPVIDASQSATFMLWGFPSLMHGKQPHINARSETAGEKRTFNESMRSRRCLVPASGFYEWKTMSNKQKEKYEITLPDRASMYMAGIYSDDGRFAILTRAASPSVAGIHDRMPVILPEDLSEVWLSESPDLLEEAITEVILQHIPKVIKEPSQMSLFA